MAQKRSDQASAGRAGAMDGISGSGGGAFTFGPQAARPSKIAVSAHRFIG
jgi:hypothetical protein